jgi:hypothetical protein
MLNGRFSYRSARHLVSRSPAHVTPGYNICCPVEICGIILTAKGGIEDEGEAAGIHGWIEKDDDDMAIISSVIPVVHWANHGLTRTTIVNDSRFFQKFKKYPNISNFFRELCLLGRRWSNYGPFTLIIIMRKGNPPEK